MRCVRRYLGFSQDVRREAREGVADRVADRFLELSRHCLEELLVELGFGAGRRRRRWWCPVGEVGAARPIAGGCITCVHAASRLPARVVCRA